jgi:hypothetical protein
MFGNLKKSHAVLMVIILAVGALVPSVVMGCQRIVFGNPGPYDTGTVTFMGECDPYYSAQGMACIWVECPRAGETDICTGGWVQECVIPDYYDQYATCYGITCY